MIGTSGATSGTDAAGLGLTIVAAGLTSASASSSVLGFLTRDAGLAAPSSFGFGTRLGFGASGRSRPLPSLTRNALARALSRGLMARTPLCPISSAATIRSLLVTPSSLASSITFIFAAATFPSPPSRFHCCVDRLARGTLDRPTRAWDHRAPSSGTRVCDHKLRADLARRAERVREPPTAERAFHALAIGTDVGPASDRASVRIGHDTAVRSSHQPHQRALRAGLAASETGPTRSRFHEELELSGESGRTSSSATLTLSGTPWLATHFSAAR